MLEKLKYLSNFYNSGKFLELQAQLNSFDKDEIEENKHLLKLCLLNAGQIGNETGCIDLSISFLAKYNLDYETILFFYINAEKSKKLNIFYESYFKLLNNIEFKSVIKNKQTEKLINFFISKNEDELALLTVRQLFKKKEEDKKLIYFLIGIVFYKLRKYRASLFWFLKLESLDDKNINVLVEIGNIYNLLRDKKNSIKYLNRALLADTLKPRVYKIMSTIYDYKTENNHFNEMIKFAMKNNEKKDDSFLLNFAISKAYEDRQDYKSSHFFFTKANIQKNAQLLEGIDIFKNEIDFFYNIYEGKSSFLYKETILKIKPIFIVGLPRSGTTLIDRILSSNSDVISYGESPQFANQFKYYFNIYNKDEAIKDFKNFDEKQISNFRDGYLNKIHKKKDISIFIDKMPFNYLYVPLIKKVFPNSIIILTKRDLRDIGLSLLKNHFADNRLNFVYSENKILEYFKLYQKVISLYKKKYKEYFYEIDYSELVSNPKKQISSLFQVCDFKIPVNDNLLNNVSNNFIADTVSVNQADKKIYTSSNMIYKNYEPFLGNFFSKIQKIYDE